MMRSVATPGERRPTEPRRRGALATVRELITTVVVAMLLYWVLQAFVLGTYLVEGRSMDDTLHDGQRMLVDKLTTRFDPYHRGDIVVLHPPNDGPSGKPYIKRVIGVAGDRIEVRHGTVWLNGLELDEPYVRSGAVTDPTTDVDAWVVDDGQVLVMGDNRDHSEDSRTFGTVRVDQIIGRAWLSFWPPDTIGILQTPTYPERR